MKQNWGFSISQIRGLLVFMFVALLCGVFFSLTTRVRVEDSFIVLADTLAKEVVVSIAEVKEQPAKIKVETKLFDFDPNTIDYRGLRSLGFSSGEAAGIIKYRTKYNKVFELPTDFAALYQVSDSMFFRLEPYINIVQTIKKDTVIVKKTVQPKLLDVNTATMEQLDSLPGIGELTAKRIIEYREKLGGYTKISQLQEVEGVLEKNYLKFYKEIFVKNDGISKIDINFAGAEIMSEHPYMTGLIIRKVLKHRQLKGGLGNITEMIQAHIITSEEAEKLSDYLVFNPL